MSDTNPVTRNMFLMIILIYLFTDELSAYFVLC